MTDTPLRRSRTASITRSILEANSHHGVLSAAGEALAQAPSLRDFRRSSVGSGGGGGGRRRGSSSVSTTTNAAATTTTTTTPASPAEGGVRDTVIDEEELAGRRESRDVGPNLGLGESVGGRDGGDDGDGDEYDDDDEGEEHGCWGTTVAFLHAFWRFFITPIGFFITIYLLNVIAWGGMLFLLLCNAAPAMCKPSCDDINSPRRIWIEITSQILNALFCVTGFGLVPWRFRDLYFLLRWRLAGHTPSLHKLEIIHAGWFRGTSGEQHTVTTTGEIAPRTKSWKMDYVVWLYAWNTFFQCVLSGFMWGMDRYSRPPWSTGLFVALACIVAGMAGGQVWWETKQVKKVEGERIVPKVEMEGGTKEKVKDKGRRFWAREERDVVRVNRLV